MLLNYIFVFHHLVSLKVKQVFFFLIFSNLDLSLLNASTQWIRFASSGFTSDGAISSDKNVKSPMVNLNIKQFQVL